MSKIKNQATCLQHCDQLVYAFEAVINNPVKSRSTKYLTGVDLGTACVVIAVLDEHHQPVAGAYRYADVVKDGMVVDYHGAVRIVRELKQEIEQKIGVTLSCAAAAIPPGTGSLDGGAVKYVVQEAGFELTNIMDEPTAANAVLKIADGAIVDIGGGTTGITIFRDGKVELVADEPTGGTHFSLVIAGAYQMDMQQADQFKRNKKNHRELMPVLKPVVEKVSTIINSYVKGYDVKQLFLVGGTCCLEGIEDVIQARTGILTYKPVNPMFVTPLGIACYCQETSR